MQNNIKSKIKILSRLWKPYRKRENIDWSNPSNRKQRWVDKNIIFLMHLRPNFPLIDFINCFQNRDKKCLQFMEAISRARLRRDKLKKEKNDE